MSEPTRMMVNDGRQSKKHISTACTWCRNRKVKCDGQVPTCSNCTLYKQECEYSRNDKRKLSHKRTIQSLTNRVAFLESLLTSYGIEVPPESTPESQLSTLPVQRNHKKGEGAKEGARDSHRTLSDLSEHAFNPESTDAIQFEKSVETLLGMNEIGNFQQAFTDVTDLFQSTAESCAPNYDFNLGGDGSRTTMPNASHTTTQEYDSLPTQSNASASTPYLPGHILRPSDGQQRRTSATNTQNDGLQLIPHDSSGSYPADPEPESNDDEVMDRLSARIGAFQIAEDGQLRYFGATSGLHILPDGLSSLPRALSRSVRIEGEEVLARAGLDRRIDHVIERHLEDLYFRWEDAAIHVVDEEMYFLAKSAYYSGGEDGSPFFSETLKNAICAAGSSLNSRTDHGLPNNAAEFFGSRAKLLLEIEMDSPSVATVQALVIMSATEAAFTRDARGWLYSGMAVRLSADLGLHLDPSTDVQDGALSDRELEVRRTTFWGVFEHDSMWSLYSGRPWSINIQDISISRPPKELDKMRSKRWTPSSNSVEGTTNVDQDKTGWYDPVETCADANVSLCMMMRQLSQIVYSDKTISDEVLREFAASMRVEFDTWLKTLPEELRVDVSDENRPYLPHVLQLHMQFQAISILLHRPFFSRSLRQPDFVGQQLSNHPRNICINAAQSIVRLLRIYRKQHTLRRTNVHIVHLVFTASLICIYNAYSSKGDAAAKSLNDLQFCCQALGEIGEAYQNSMRALEVTICIKREWFGKMRNLSRTKRRSPATEDRGMDEMRRKRRLTRGQEDIAQPTTSIADIPGLQRGAVHVGDRDLHQLDAWESQYNNNGQRANFETFYNDIFASR